MQIQKGNHITSLIKGVTWRIVGTMDTMVLSYIFTGSIENSVKIGFTEVFTKVFLFYLHERIWLKIKWGLVGKVASNALNENASQGFDSQKDSQKESRIRSVIKGISWRIMGTLDTIIIATVWTGDYSQALRIGFTEVISKVVLFYYHERIWMYYLRKKADATPKET